MGRKRKGREDHFSKERDTDFADFFRYHLFIKLHRGDIERWIDYLKTDAPEHEAKCDMEFALWLRERLEEDKGLLQRTRKMVQESDQQLDEILQDGAAIIGLIVLFRGFRGNINEWIEDVITNGSEDQLLNDLSFAKWLKYRIDADPAFYSYIRRWYEERIPMLLNREGSNS